jgi:ATP-dependent helicase Lhr and Lhr-like helicase
MNTPPTGKPGKTIGLQLLWITPLRALAKDIGRAMEEVISELGMAWQVGVRNGDTSTSERARQKKQMPEVLIITPESLHLLLAMKGHPDFFKTLRIIAVDEWHELLGSKRGVQVELAISYLVGKLAGLQVEKSESRKGGKLEGGVLSHSQPPTANCQLQTANCQLQTANCQLSTAHCQLSTAHCQLTIWGISATIGNLDEAREVLLTALEKRRNCKSRYG